MSYTSSYTTESNSYQHTEVSLTDDTSWSSDSVTATVEMSSPDDSEGLAAAVGGEAIAVGDDTLAVGSLSAELIDGGVVTSADLTASMTAVSESEDDETALASADTFANVSDSADVVLTFQTESDSGELGETGSVAAATSTTHLAAFDISIGDDGNEIVEQEPIAPAQSGAPEEYLAPWDGSLDGNIATLEFEALAVGEDSLVSADAFVIAVEDELSMSTVFVELAVD